MKPSIHKNMNLIDLIEEYGAAMALDGLYTDPDGDSEPDEDSINWAARSVALFEEIKVRLATSKEEYQKALIT